MTQEFELYEGSATESASVPRITVRRSGQMILTQAAVDLLGDGVAFVQIGYDQGGRSAGRGRAHYLGGTLDLCALDLWAKASS